ncbi:hypothetical protein JYP46_01385 [Nitratireductor aquimarinus]|uniref:hypothetical protein n=1 Tax=Alphaproteobacteria TaxID=28211 RepID=UPI0019D3D891|nr:MULTISPECIES: hypothetical protein [Alphaproteobacteria]MBN7755463.1 hypothetical protein [Nitratireductor aquimarinus]MBY5998218.1 hypothetical protein [Tritonibacter mobilis]MBY6020245.1 hypothetical protein [Nitratireductor sp. DP7N14-4]
MSKIDDPIRIYATVHGASTVIPTGIRQLIGGWIEFQTKPNATEYVRGDIAAEMLEALEAMKDCVLTARAGFEVDPDKAWEALKQANAALSKATGGE